MLDKIELSVPAARPILLTNETELAIIKSRLSEPPYQTLYSALLDLALADPAEVTSPLAAAADVDPRFFDVGWRLMGMESVLPAAGVAWQLTGECKFLDAALNHLRTGLAWTHWSDGRHDVVDGFYDAGPETASGMRAFAWALDLFDDALPPDLARACRKRLSFFAQRLTELSKAGSTSWARDASDDWAASIYSAVGHSALAIFGTDSRAKNWLEHALARILAYLDSLPLSGGHPSGVARWEFSLTHCCMFLEALYRFSGVDLRRHPAIERTRRFAVRCVAPGLGDIVQIDQGMPLRISNVTKGPLSKLLAKWFQDPVIRWIIRRTPRTGNIQAQDILWFDDSLPELPPWEDGEGSADFSDMGWVVMRSGWSDTDNLVAFKSSPYRPGFHHLDQNSFEIFGRGGEIAQDSGLGWRAHPNYFERYRDSIAHNTILVNGQGQMRHTPESHGGIEVVSWSDSADYTVGECAAAYEGIKEFRRALLFLKPDVLVVRDVIKLEHVVPLQWLMHGAGSFTIHAHKEDRGFTIVAENAALQAFICQPERWKHSTHRGYKLTNWQTRHEETHPVLTITPDTLSCCSFLVVMKIQDSSEPREFPGEILNENALKLCAGGKSWRVGATERGLDYSEE